MWWIEFDGAPGRGNGAVACTLLKTLPPEVYGALARKMPAGASPKAKAKAKAVAKATAKATVKGKGKGTWASLLEFRTDLVCIFGHSDAMASGFPNLEIACCVTQSFRM